jgi:hypothetical protein
MTSCGGGVPTPKAPRPVHRVHLKQRTGDHRPADRPPPPRPQPLEPGRAVSRLALSRRFSPIPGYGRSGLNSATAAAPGLSGSSPTGPTARLAHLPSGSFRANVAGWLWWPSAVTCCAPLASWPASSTPARGATLRRDLTYIAVLNARHGRGGVTVNVTGGWRRAYGWMKLSESACGPPAVAA